MFHSTLILITAIASVSYASQWKRAYPGEPATPHILNSFTNLVTFGDSYTDENRLNYFQKHNGSAPPAGTLVPQSNSTASGGVIWDRFVADYSGAKLYDYAVSGAVCSNSITPRSFEFGIDFPSVLEYEVPAFLNDINFINTSTGTNTLFTDRQSDNTVYSLWIGTNDLGNNAFITDSQVAGKKLPDFTSCIFQALDGIYQAGGRFFVLLNQAPLQLSPLYGLPDAGGVYSNHYWPSKPANITEISYKMLEYTTTVNNILTYQVPFELIVARRYPGASIAIYDVNSLITDIYNNPTQYLEAPANVTGYYRYCNLNSSVCTPSEEPAHSFLWYDELHPSERTDQIIAQEFLNVVGGNSSYATYW